MRLGQPNKDLRREHVRLAKQNALAAEYLFNQQEGSSETGLSASEIFEDVIDSEQETSQAHLEMLLQKEILPDMIADDALRMNKDLRDKYEQDLEGKTAFAEQFGQSRERLLPFEAMFTPSEGWERFLERFGEGGEG